jgi:hypothetical protein
MQTESLSIERRRWFAEQAIADAKIEGFEPDQAFLEDMEQVVQGKMTDDEAVARIIERGNAEELAAEQAKVGRL